MNLTSVSWDYELHQYFIFLKVRFRHELFGYYEPGNPKGIDICNFDLLDFGYLSPELITELLEISKLPMPK